MHDVTDHIYSKINRKSTCMTSLTTYTLKLTERHMHEVTTIVAPEIERMAHALRHYPHLFIYVWDLTLAIRE